MCSAPSGALRQSHIIYGKSSGCGEKERDLCRGFILKLLGDISYTTDCIEDLKKLNLIILLTQCTMFFCFCVVEFIWMGVNVLCEFLNDPFDEQE